MILLLCLPIAALAVLHPPNEYEAALGGNYLDCMGPSETYMFAAPTLLVYGTALLINGRRWRKRTNLIVAIACFALCAGTMLNVARAVAEDRRQAEECAAR